LRPALALVWLLVEHQGKRSVIGVVIGGDGRRVVHESNPERRDPWLT